MVDRSIHKLRNLATVWPINCKASDSTRLTRCTV